MEVTEITKIVREGNRGNRGQIAKAKQHENRIALHSETTVDVNSISKASTEFLHFVRSLLPKDKYSIFLNLFRVPVASVPLTSQIYKALSKIWDGRNPVFNYEFISEEFLSDWKEYREHKLGATNRWKTEGFETLKTAINSIVIVDLDKEQTSERPEPYYYFLDISKVWNLGLKKDGTIEYIMFPQAEEKLAVFCDTHYRVFEFKKNQITETPLYESEHNLGYCPAAFFWSTPINYKTPLVKQSPLSNQLAKLDMLLFFEVSNDHLNLYGRYPIYSGFTVDCDFEDSESGKYCDDGFLRGSNHLYIFTGDRVATCPVCTDKRLNGAGSYVEVDPPNSANDNADLRNPVQITSIPVESLEYNNEDIKDRKSEIFTQVTGYQGTAISNKAVNKDQVKAVFESLETALLSPQQNFETIIEFVDSTICRLRYGDYFRSCSISLGTEHYILSPSELLEMYQLAKEKNSPVAVLDMLENKYYETEYKKDSQSLNRHKILIALDPLRHKTGNEALSLFNLGLISKETYLLKENFSTLVQRFERENLPLTLFGIGLDFDKRIAAIKDSLSAYAKEMIPISEEEKKPTDED